MPTDGIYYTPDVPDDQKQAVKAIANLVCSEDGIESVFPLLTNTELPQELVINASNLPDVASSTAVSPEMLGTLESLVSQFTNILIIPEWRINLDGAIRGDRGAAYRLVEPLAERDLVNQYLPAEHFRERAEQIGISAEQARLDLLTDAMLEVVQYGQQMMFIRSAKDSELLRHPDGRPDLGSPSDIEEYTFWRWAECEAVKNAEALLYGCRYAPQLTIEAIPPDGEPARLWMPFSGEPLVLARGRGGRPLRSDSFGGAREGFLARVSPAIVALQADSKHPSVEKVAEFLGISEDTLIRARKQYQFPDWESVIQAVIQEQEHR
jgi:hypothetical protein